MTHGDTPGIDEKVKLTSAQKGDPIEPMHTRSQASSINGTRGQRGGRESETATTRATERVVGKPSRSVKSGKVSFEYELQLEYGCWREMEEERMSEIVDCMRYRSIDI